MYSGVQSSRDTNFSLGNLPAHIAKGYDEAKSKHFTIPSDSFVISLSI